MTQDDNTARLRALLDRCLEQHFGIDDSEFHAFVEAECEFVELPAGQTLIRQGERSTAVYFLLSGHMRALVEAEGKTVPVGEIGRGQTIGELALFTGKPRSADVVAIRDSIVAKLTDEVLKEAIRRQPDIAFRITEGIIARNEKQRAVSAPPAPPVTLTILPITPDVDARAFADQLAEARESWGDRVKVMDAAYVMQVFGGLEQPDTTLPRGELSLAIGTMELEYDALIFVANAQAPAWSQTAVHHSDEVVLLADARARPDLSDVERGLLERRPNLRATQTLVLHHEPDTVCPRGTPDWLAQRNVSRHIHMRRNHAADRRRVARLLSGRGIGLVLAGGGARGLTHLGILEGLDAHGIEYDMIGGTSAGAIMGSFAAMDVPGAAIRDTTRHIFLESQKGNITGDYNLVPYISLLRGERAHGAMDQAIEENGRPGMDMTDCWKTFFTIASDFTERREVVLRDGPFGRNVVASASIPGVMPPTLIDGHLIFDGGSFNNFPVDHMRALGARYVIGSDLLSDHVRTHDLHEAPTSARALWDKLKPGKGRYRLPTLPATLLAATTVTSMSRQKGLRDHVDLLFQPDTRGFTLLSWQKYDAAFEAGRKCAEQTLERTDPALLAALSSRKEDR